MINFNPSAVAIVYVVMTLLIFQGACLYYKDLDIAIRFAARVIVTALAIIAVLCVLFGTLAAIACIVHGYNFIDLLRKCSV